MRWAALAVLLAGCASSPPSDAYFAYRGPGGEQRLTTDDQLLLGRTVIDMIPGGFAAGQRAFATLPPPPANDQRFRYYDGDVSHAMSEAVWRQAKGIPPFVDAL